MRVPFLCLKDITAKNANELQEAVLRVTNSGLYLFGNEVKLFEKNYADYIGTKYCIGWDIIYSFCEVDDFLFFFCFFDKPEYLRS